MCETTNMQKTLFLFLLCVLFCAAYAGDNARCIRKNEVLRCVYQCPPEKTCDTKDVEFSCLRIECEKCENKCVCADGHFRNDIGDCVPREQCDRCPGQNEFCTCSTECDNECGKLGIQNRTNCPIVNKKCNDRCYCKNGYSRNATGVCIPNKECPNIRCPNENEHLGCVINCEPTCENRTVETGNWNCKPQCVCNKGLYRNSEGKCVTEEECNRCPGQNEYRTCSTECDNYCGKLGIQNRTICPIVNVKCNDRCYCKDGFSRNATGVCIPNEECPNIRCPNENENLGCVIDSEPTCQNRTVETGDCNCKPQCVCNKGLFRDSNGNCVPAEYCDKCKDPNEFFTCGNECDTECSRPNVQNRTNCQTNNEPCVEMCYCKDGYARDANNKCVPTSKCPQATCDQNEIYRCKRSCPPEATCNTRNATYNCPLQRPNDPCNSTCICKENYYRNHIGHCISREECDKCKGAHEFYDPCGGACDNVCSTLDTQSRCNCNIQTFACVKMCYCEDGYARNETNHCVPIKECIKGCKGPHEYHMTCLKTCPPDTCASRLARYNCPKNPPCVPGCHCQSGFLRKKKLCRPLEQC